MGGTSVGPARRVALLITTLALLASAPAAPAAETLINLSGTSIVGYSADNGAALGPPVTITGLASGFSPVGIDFRPATNELILLTLNTSSTDQLRLYTVNTATGSATAIGGAVASPATNDSTGYAIDVNPAGDVLRVVTVGGQKNFRMNLTTGALLGPDTNLTFAPGDANSGTPVVSALAHDNNVGGASSSTTFGVHVFSTTAFLERLGSAGGSPASPDGGVLSTIGTGNSFGPFGGSVTGFDISGATGTAYAAAYSLMITSATYYLYRVDLATGQFARVPGDGLFGDVTVAPTNTIELTASSASAGEKAGTGTFTVTRSGVDRGAVSVGYTTADGSAAAGSDYTASSGTLTFAEGETSKTITVPVADDAADEGREALSVQLSNATGNTQVGAILGRKTATLTIEDDDAAPVVTQPTVTTTPDTTAPTTTLTGVPASLTRAKFLEGFAIALTPNEPAAFDVTLAGKTKKASLAALRVQLFNKSLPLAAGSRPLLVKPARKGVGRVRKNVKVTLHVVATDAAGNRSTVKRTITVKPDPKRKPKRG